MYKVIFIVIIISLLLSFNNGYDYLPTMSSKCSVNEYFNVETLSCDFCDPNLSLVPNTNSEYILDILFLRSRNYELNTLNFKHFDRK